MKTRTWLCMTLVTGVLVAGTVTLRAKEDGQETELGFAQLPTAVQATVRKVYPDAKVTECVKEKERGTTRYTVELQVAAGEVTVELDGCGTIRETALKIPVTELPQAVSRRLATVVPEGRVKEAERKTEDGRRTYEVEMLCKGVSFDLELDSSGKILEIDVEQGERGQDQHGEHGD